MLKREGKEKERERRSKGENKGADGNKGGFSKNSIPQKMHCYNCKSSENWTLCCPQPLSMEAREKSWKTREEHEKKKKKKKRKESGEKKENKGKKKSCLTLDNFPKVLQTPFSISKL